MLVVKVELHSAITGRVSELGRMIIFNDGTGTRNRGNYGVRIGRKGQTENQSVFDKPVREGEVKDYPRLSYPVWRLVLKALKACYPEEKET